MADTMLARLIAANELAETARQAKLNAQAALDRAKAAQEKADVALDDVVMEACSDMRHRDDVSKYRAWVKAKRK